MENTANKKLIIFFLVLIVFLAYQPVLKNNFVNWDDDVHFLKNPSVRYLDLEHLKKIFTESVNKTYIPLTTLSFAVENRLFDKKPFFYHLDNLILHLLVTVLVFVFAYQCGLSPYASFFAALLFGVHPVHVESVAWVTERKDVLYAFFYMLALVSYSQYLAADKRSAYVRTVIFGLLSILAKPMAVSLPLILLVCDRLHGRKVTAKVFAEKIPFFAYAAAIGWLTFSLHVGAPDLNLKESPLIWAWTFVFYLRQFIFPKDLIPLYHLPYPIALKSFHYFLPLAFLVLILIGLYYFRKNRWLVFAFAFYFFSIFFLLRFDESFDVRSVSDRFMYLPSVGFCMLLGFLFENILLKLKKPSVQNGFVFFCAAALIALSLKTSSQCGIWKNSILLWSHQLRFFPDTVTALNNLATAYSEEKEFREAVSEYRVNFKPNIIVLRGSPLETAIRGVEKLVGMYKKAIEIDPSYTDAYYNLANVYKDIGRNKEAADIYLKVLELDDNYKDASYNLGLIYAQLDKPDDAIAAFKKTIAADPANEDVYVNVIKAYNDIIRDKKGVPAYETERKDLLLAYKTLISRKPKSAVSYFNIGWVHSEIGDLKEAISNYEKALELKPGYTNALYNLGNAYKDSGQIQEAIERYTEVLKLDPQNADACLNLGITYNILGDRPRAIGFYKKAIEIDPKHTNAYFNLGFSYEVGGDLAAAIESYTKAAELNPQHAEAFYNLGNCYAKHNENQKAIESYKKAIGVKPAHMDALVNLSVICFREGQFKEAAEYCERARKLGYEAPEEYLKALEPYK